MIVLKLNLGSKNPEWKEQKEKGWTTVDIVEGADITMDLRKHNLPWDDNIVDLIYCSHFIEHITHKEARNFLKECIRMLRPGGIIRIVFPEYSYTEVPQITIIEYLSGAKSPSELTGEEKYTYDKTYMHLYAYTVESMKYELKRVGFTKIVECKPLESILTSSDTIAFLDDIHQNNLITEGMKSGNI